MKKVEKAFEKVLGANTEASVTDILIFISFFYVWGAILLIVINTLFL